MSRFLKWVGILLLVLLLPVVVGIGCLVFAPNPTLSWLLRTTADMEYQASSTAFGLWPIAVELNDAEIKPIGGEPMATIHSGELRFHLWQYLTNAPTVWSLEGDQVTFFVPESTPESTSDATPTDSSSDASALDLRLPLAFSRVAVEQLTIKPASGEATSLSFKLDRQTDDSQDMTGVNTTITLHQPNREDFSVTGTLSYQLGSTNKLELSIPELDLNPLLTQAAPESAGSAEQEGAGAEAEAVPAEAAMDWAWLQTLGKLEFALKVTHLIAAEHELNNFSGQLTTDNKNLRLSDLSGEYQMKATADAPSIVQSFKSSLVLTPLAQLTQGSDANIDLTVEADHFNFSTKGRANLNGMGDNQLDLTLAISDFKILGEMLNKDMQPLTPLAFTTKVEIDPTKITLSELDLTAGENDLKGQLELTLASADNEGLGGLTAVTANLVASQLLLQPLKDLHEIEEAAAEDEPTDTAADESTTLLFSKDPLPLTALADFVADVSLTAAKLKILEADFTELAITLGNNEGGLQLSPQAKFGGGGFNGDFLLKPTADSADLDITFAMNDINLEAFGLVSKDQLTGGTTNFDMAINGRGASTAAIAASTKGKLLLTVTDAVVQNDTFELAGSDLIMELLSKLNPFAKSDPTTKLSCALVKFDGVDGVWSTKNQLVVETEKMEIIGTGKIDLTDESIDLGITPSAKGGVGVNIGSLVKFLKLGGTLSAPRPAADAAGLLKSGAAIGAAASTGGLSILADSLAKRAMNSGDACKKAREPEAAAVSG